MNFFNLCDNPEPSPSCEYYEAAGAICSLSTNSELILAAANTSFRRIPKPSSPPDVSMRFWVYPTGQSRPPWPSPYFRGLSHLVFAAFDSQNSVLVDLRKRRAIGRFSPAMAGDRSYWRRVIFPALFGIVSETVGVTALHCACVERSGRGLLLAGDSGSGKSTLSLALAQSGFAFLSDDWTYFSRRNGRLLAWGLPTPLKLLPPAVEYFPELAGLAPGLSLNGELAYEVEPDQVFGVQRSRCVEPDRLIFLERCDEPTFSLSEMSPVDAAPRLEEDLERLPPAVSEARDYLVKTIRILVQRSCWVLRYGGTPRAVAKAVSDWIEQIEGARSGTNRENLGAKNGIT